MKHGLPFLLVLTLLAGSLALPQSSPPAAANKPVPKKAVPKTASTAKKTTASKKGKTAKKPTVAAATWRNRQMEPTPERYKEIQQALVDKGYLKSEPNGVWDAESTAAMLQFQTEKKLSPTGKLSAASLIALGLGPKTSADAQVQPPAPILSPPASAPEN